MWHPISLAEGYHVAALGQNRTMYAPACGAAAWSDCVLSTVCHTSPSVQDPQ
jgi:hypothetical protein